LAENHKFTTFGTESKTETETQSTSICY